MPELCRSLVVFVIWDGMELAAKRIEHMPHCDLTCVIFRSINPEYDSSQRLAEEAHIGGRADWVSRRLEGTRRDRQRDPSPRNRKGWLGRSSSCEADQAGIEVTPTETDKWYR